jgi:CCR4-NOT transcription complex subunit 1
MLLQFMAPLLEAASFSVGALDMFNATQRTLLVILHDFPEFLSEYYFSLCDAIPVRCVQMRNIILSAFPSNVTLPDTASPVDGVADYTTIPPIIPDFSLMLRQSEILPIVDQMLSKRAPLSSLELIKEKLFIGLGDSNSQSVEDISYDLHMMDSLVLYIGALSVAQAKTKPDGPTFNSNDAGVVVLEQLAKELDYEGIMLAHRCVSI